MHAGGGGGEGGQRAQREFRDIGGHLWIVVERRIPVKEWTESDVESSRAGYGVGWLRFTSSSELPRRLRLYPSQWQHLSDDALEGLRSRAREELRFAD